VLSRLRGSGAGETATDGDASSLLTGTSISNLSTEAKVADFFV
jgi:hypothetical protein